MKAHRTLSCIAVFLGVVSCGGGDGGTGVQPDQPDPGPVTMMLATPNTNDGALLITVSGGRVADVTSEGNEVVSAESGPTTVSLIVRGILGSGPIARAQVPDRKQLRQYRVTIVEAAARTTYVQQNLSGYSATLIAP